MNAFKESQLPDFKVAKLEAKADFYWDKFYKFHAERFFKDRHWFSAEFPALLTANAVFEVGCGVGNTIFPLLDINPTVHVYACDFAPTAINIVHQHPLYQSSNRITAFVADLISDDVLSHVPRGIVDACTMIFVLSAISPEAMPAAVANVKQTLRRSGGSGGNGGGQILFRDYAAGDLAQERLQRDYKQQRIGEGFYMRGDGTRAYYFTENFVLDLFEQQGFRCEDLVVKEMKKVNRSTGVCMGRKFIHGVFTLVDEREENGIKETKKDHADDGDGFDGGENGEKKMWTAFKRACCIDPLENASSIQDTSLVFEEEIVKEEDEDFEVVQLGDKMILRLENLYKDDHLKEEIKKTTANSGSSSCASKILAELVLQCPTLFHDFNVVQVRCGGSGTGSNRSSGSGLPLFAAVRWCRRALAVDRRREAVEVFRRNAVRNGWQVAYEKLRVAIEPPPLSLSLVKKNSINGDDSGSENEGWVSGAFKGPIGGVLACIDSGESLIIVQEVLSSASKVLEKGKGGFLLLVGPKKLVSSEGGGDGDVVVEMAGLVGFKVCELPPEVVCAMENVDLADNSVIFLRKL